MNRVLESLSNANAFERENKFKYAYFKYIDAVLCSMNIMMFSEKPDEDDLNRLDEIIKKSFARSEKLFEFVMDLDEKSSEKVMKKTIITVKHPVIMSQENQKKPLQTLQPLGKEPMIGSRSDDNLPLIPSSQLTLKHGYIKYKLQLLLQKFENFSLASAKQRCNALYLSGLGKLIRKIINYKEELFGFNSILREVIGSVVKDWTPTDLARQMTLILFRFYKETDIENINDNKEYFDIYLYFEQIIKYLILVPESESQRASILIHFVKMLDYLKEYGNFAGIKLVVSAISANSIQRLRKTMNLVPRKLKNKLDSYSHLIKDHKTFKKEIRLHQGAKMTPIDANDENVDKDMLIVCKNSIYEEIISHNDQIEHFLLIQPFRWPEELDQLSGMREEIGGLTGIDSDPNFVFPEQQRRISGEENDHYQILEKKFEHPAIFTSLRRKSAKEDDSVDIR